jgi:hypothetical protein
MFQFVLPLGDVLLPLTAAPSLCHYCHTARRAQHHVRCHLVGPSEHRAVHAEHHTMRCIAAHRVRAESPHRVRFCTLARRRSEHGSVRFALRHRTRYDRLDMRPASQYRGNGDG